MQSQIQQNDLCSFPRQRIHNHSNPSLCPTTNTEEAEIEWFYEDLQRRQWHPTPVLLPGKSHGQRSLVGCSPWAHEESDVTEWLHLHFSLSCIGEGNGNPLQCSCLENPRDGETGGLPSMGSHRVRNNWSDLAAAAAAWRPTRPFRTNTQKRCPFHYRGLECKRINSYESSNP